MKPVILIPGKLYRMANKFYIGNYGKETIDLIDKWFIFLKMEERVRPNLDQRRFTFIILLGEKKVFIELWRTTQIDAEECFLRVKNED